MIKTFLRENMIDLISYYYRASTLNTSEFKYIAFYQVLECLFDEVYLETTVEEIRQILNSNWFSSNDSKDLGQLITLIEQYRQNKNDREKLKLVLEKYFKGNIHNEVFLCINKDLQAILIEELELISKKEDTLDMQKIACIIYETRCNFAHSKREYPFKTEYQFDQSKIEIYITLIRKVAERVIVNYQS